MGNEYGRVLTIKNYWMKKQHCIFENCLFDKHRSLSCEHEHIKYYMEEVIGIKEITVT
jgi:hypothetical protein